jgi:hypothetical protein
MSHLFTRRGFMTSAGTAALSLALTRPSCAAYGFRFHHDDEFSGEWVPWLSRAVGAAMRMIAPHVIANYVRLNRTGHNLAAGVWERSNNANNRFSYWRSPAHLLEYQLRSLQINDFQPKLTIRWAHEPDASWWGKANLGTAALTYNAEIDDVEMDGEFEILLNAYWATTNDSRNQTDVWGGVIAHEMLHNLGHGHGPGEYDDRWPINILDRCVTHNGRYRGRYRQFNWLCGGRLTS